jgi:NCS1 family nucleobase:cation symporter-1
MPGFVAAVQPTIIMPIELRHLYYICFLSGFAISSAVFCFLHFMFSAHEITGLVTRSPPPRVLMNEYQDRWDGEISEGIENDVNKHGIVTDREVPHFRNSRV